MTVNYFVLSMSVLHAQTASEDPAFTLPCMSAPCDNDMGRDVNILELPEVRPTFYITQKVNVILYVVCT